MAHERGESDWGDWLPRAIERADPETVAVWYLGCNGLVLKGSGGTTVFVDPYCGTGDPPRTVRMIPVPFDPEDVAAADAVLATHEHSDHVHGPTQGPLLAGTDATYYAPDASLDVVAGEGWTDAYGLDDGRLREVSEGESFAVGEFDVRVVEVNDPDAAHPVGYLFEHEAGTVFHGGDTRPADAFPALGSRHDVDLGVVAFGTVGRLLDPSSGGPARKRWYCDENQVVEVANALQLDRLIPTHWDVWKGLTADPTALHHHVRSFDYPRRLEVAEIGDRIDL
ncbi:MAG: MBL fold metallo-hydrolase [Haloferacaceae archaeon]